MVVPVQKIRDITAGGGVGDAQKGRSGEVGKKGLENSGRKYSSGSIGEDKVEMLRRKRSKGKILLKGNKWDY